MHGYDVIVVGLGGMGSAAAAHLAARGQRVLGLERFGPAHDRGSSHGGSRIIRQSYFEDPAYVPLLLRAYELWDQLRATPGRRDHADRRRVPRAAGEPRRWPAACARPEEWGLPHEMLDAAEIRRRFPTLTPGRDEVACTRTTAGFVRPEATVPAHLDAGRAARGGAALRRAGARLGGDAGRRRAGDDGGRHVRPPGGW